MNLESKLNGAVDDILRSAGFIFEVINHNKRNSNLILGPNTHLVSSIITEHLLESLARFDSILDETVGKFNDTRWCIDLIIESKNKQNELRLKEEEEKRKKAAELERIRKEEEAKLKREEEEREAKRKKEEEEAAAAAAAAAEAAAAEAAEAKRKLEQEKQEEQKRLENELLEQERKKKEEEANKKKENEANKINFDSGFNFSPGFDFNMDDFGGGLDMSNGNGDVMADVGGNDTNVNNNGDIVMEDLRSGSTPNKGGAPSVSGGNVVSSNGNGGEDRSKLGGGVDDDMYLNFDNINVPASKPNADAKPGDDDMNTLLDNDTLLLDGLNMDLYEGDAGLGGAAGEEFDVDSFLNQFGGGD